MWVSLHTYIPTERKPWPRSKRVKDIYQVYFCGSKKLQAAWLIHSGNIEIKYRLKLKYSAGIKSNELDAQHDRTT